MTVIEKLKQKNDKVLRANRNSIIQISYSMGFDAAILFAIDNIEEAVNEFAGKLTKESMTRTADPILSSWFYNFAIELREKFGVKDGK